MFKKKLLFWSALLLLAVTGGNLMAQEKCNYEKDPFINLLCDLIRTRPESSNIAAVNKAQAKMMQFLSARGIHCTMERDGERDVLFAATTPGKVMDYILCVHMDVVPAINEKQYEPVIKDGVMYARGCKDCLGHAVSAAKILCSVPAGKKVGCIFTANEEIGGSTTAFMVQKGYTATKMGFVLDGGNGVVYAQKGIINFTVTAYGKGGHSSAPWVFDNPVEKLVTGLHNVVSKWENPTSLDDWRPSLAVTVLKASNASNRVPDKAEATINVRVVSLEDFDRIQEFIQKNSGLEVKRSKTTDPFSTDPNSKEMQQVLAAYNRAFKRDTKPMRMSGATDARHLYKIGCPIFITGIDGKDSHGADESIELESIDKLVSMILDII